MSSEIKLIKTFNNIKLLTEPLTRGMGYYTSLESVAKKVDVEENNHINIKSSDAVGLAGPYTCLCIAGKDPVSGYVEHNSSVKDNTHEMVSGMLLVAGLILINCNNHIIC